MQRRNEEKAEGTYVAVPDIGFQDRYDLALWLPDEKLLITGDLGFHQRLLAVFEDTDTFEELAGKNAGRVYQDLEFEYF
ncbi:hypothetical protein [Marinobacter changyiensis]|uniref:hypothetical protein n=1 Tax=Marinobacter changyiensis TaxID=2604091 RepID=UPI00126460B7|nr:hypothetical protein [Marinobacter changyiensis]